MKNIRIRSLIFAMVLSVGFFAGCGNSTGDEAQTTQPAAQGESADDEVAGDTAEPTAERTTLTVGFDASFPPYGYLDEESKEYIGFDLDLAAEVCKRQGWELELRAIDWDSKDLELSSGAIDCIWNGFTINGREDQYTWTVPYADNVQVIVVAADSGITSFADLAGKTVAVQNDSSAYKALTDAGDEDMAALTASFGELLQVPEYNTAFMNLEMGAADAVAMDVGVAEYQMESRDGSYVILEETLINEEYGVGFKLGNEELRDTVQATMLEMAQDGTFARIAEEWGLTDSIVLGK